MYHFPHQLQSLQSLQPLQPYGITALQPYSLTDSIAMSDFLFSVLPLDLDARIVERAKLITHFSEQVLGEMCDIVTELNLLRADLLSHQYSVEQTSFGECALDEWYETFTDNEIMSPEDRVQLENLGRFARYTRCEYYDRCEYFSSISLIWHLEDNVLVW